MSDEHGFSLIEYALLIALLGMVLIAVLVPVGGGVGLVGCKAVFGLDQKDPTAVKMNGGFYSFNAQSRVSHCFITWNDIDYTGDSFW
jgi:hypothetical protein